MMDIIMLLTGCLCSGLAFGFLLLLARLLATRT